MARSSDGRQNEPDDWNEVEQSRDDRQHERGRHAQRREDDECHNPGDDRGDRVSNGIAIDDIPRFVEPCAACLDDAAMMIAMTITIRNCHSCSHAHTNAAATRILVIVRHETSKDDRSEAIQRMGVYGVHGMARHERTPSLHVPTGAAQLLPVELLRSSRRSRPTFQRRRRQAEKHPLSFSSPFLLLTVVSAPLMPSLLNIAAHGSRGETRQRVRQSIHLARAAR